MYRKENNLMNNHVFTFSEKILNTDLLFLILDLLLKIFSEKIFSKF